MAEGQRFKTGYLAAPIDYGAIGQSVGQAFANPIMAVAAERTAKRDAKVKALNPGAAAGEAVPGQLNARYKDAAQLALDIYQETAVNFEADPSAENQQAFVDAKNQYQSIVQDAKFGTQFIAQKYSEVQSNQELIEAGLLDSNLASLEAYSLPGVYTRQGNVVFAGDQPYFNSGASASNPENLWVESGSIVGDYKYTSDKVGTQVFNSQFAQNKQAFYEKEVIGNSEVNVGFKQEEFGDALAEQYNVFGQGHTVMWNSAAMEGYKFGFASNRDLVEDDLNQINTTMHPELFNLKNTDGISIAKIETFDAEGKPVYAISDDELNNIQRPQGISIDDVKRFRQGQSVHAEGYYRTIKGQFADVDTEYVTELRNLQSGMTTTLGPQDIPFSGYVEGGSPAVDPTLSTAYPNLKVGSIPNAGRFSTVMVSNQNLGVEKAIVNLTTGEVIGYKIKKDQSVIEALSAVPQDQRTTDQVNLLALLSSEQDIYVNKADQFDAFKNIEDQLSRQGRKNKTTPSYLELIQRGQSEIGIPAADDEDASQQQTTTDVNILNQGAGVTTRENGGVIPESSTQTAAPSNVRAGAAPPPIDGLERPGIVPASTEETDPKKDQSSSARTESETKEFFTAEEQRVREANKESEARWEAIKEKIGYAPEDFWGTGYANDTEFFKQDGINLITDEASLQEAIREFGNPPEGSIYRGMAESRGMLNDYEGNVPVGVQQEDIVQGYNRELTKEEQANFGPKSQYNTPMNQGKVDVTPAQSHMINYLINESGMTEEAAVALASVSQKESSGDHTSREKSWVNNNLADARSIFSGLSGVTETEWAENQKKGKEGFDNWFWEKVYGKDSKKGKQLGNTEEGDGQKFRGRGLIQITGRSNYAAASEYLFGDDRLIKNPELIEEDPEVAGKVAAWFMLTKPQYKKLEKTGLLKTEALDADSTQSILDHAYAMVAGSGVEVDTVSTRKLYPQGMPKMQEFIKLNP